MTTGNEELIDLLENGYKFPVFWAKPIEHIVETKQVETIVETEAPQKRGRKAK